MQLGDLGDSPLSAVPFITSDFEAEARTVDISARTASRTFSPSGIRQIALKAEAARFVGEAQRPGPGAAKDLGSVMVEQAAHVRGRQDFGKRASGDAFGETAKVAGVNTVNGGIADQGAARVSMFWTSTSTVRCSGAAGGIG
ncbi:MAG: hypothetical protein M3P40_06845 [Actinomycetota bacterium]|nr:hypothetical protein [Actinomycetota bacterium]